MKVVSYYKVVPPQNTSNEKTDILVKFINGVKIKGDVGILHTGFDVIDADVAIIQGWQHEVGKDAAHLRLRQAVIDHQLLRKKFVCTADSNLFLYANKTNSPHHYLRYSLNGIFPNTGIYFDRIIDPNRWQQISKDTGIVLENKKLYGKNILICCQRNGGWSMGKLDVIDWLNNTIKEIRKYSDRPILVRPHPGDKKAANYLNPKNNLLKPFLNVEISKINTPLETDLKDTWCVVNHNSSSIVGPIIKGYPAFITDPEKSQCKDVANTNFKYIERPLEFDRLSWLERISMFHWKFSELEDGSAWKHIRNYCQ